MVKADFARWLKQALAYFERKEPSDATVDLWYERVRDIPAQALPRIYQDLTEQEAFPRNLPAFMWARSQEWLSANPRFRRLPDGNCECHRGFFDVAFWRPELAEWAVFTFPCGLCNHSDGPRSRFDLLNPNLYDREPNRYQESPPPWGLIYLDEDSVRKKCQEVRDYLKHHRQNRVSLNNLEVEETLPF